MIITLCGSARFEPWFHAWNEALSIAGHCVFGLGSYPSFHGGEKDWYTDAEKSALDRVHKAKIDASDAVLFLNPFAYIGESTVGDYHHAVASRKRVVFLESWAPGRGIGGNHNEGVRRAMRAYGVPDGYGSPIPTHAYPGPFSTDFLGPGGATRSVIVERLRTQAALIEGGGR